MCKRREALREKYAGFTLSRVDPPITIMASGLQFMRADEAAHNFSGMSGRMDHLLRERLD